MTDSRQHSRRGGRPCPPQPAADAPRSRRNGKAPLRRAGPMCPACPARQRPPCPPAWQPPPQKTSTRRSGCLLVTQYIRLSLGELRCPTGGLQTVLKQYYCLFPCIYKALRGLSSGFLFELTHLRCRVFLVLYRWPKGFVYYFSKLLS